MGLTPGQDQPSNSYGTNNFNTADNWTEASIRSFGKADVLDSYEGGETELDIQIKQPIQDLIDDVDLLNGVSAYGAAYMSANIWNINNEPILPFSTQIGPNKLVDIAPDGPGSLSYGELRGYDEGLWQVHFATRAEGTPYSGDDWAGVNMYIDIYDSPSHILFSYNPKTVQSPGTSEATLCNTYSFVVPESVHHFDVWMTCFSHKWRKFTGGAAWSILALRRISIDVDHDDDPDDTVPDGNDPP
jgi:hypothetical protein